MTDHAGPSSRPGLFSVPSETSLRFLLLVGVLVASVLVVAESLYYSARADHLNAVIRECEAVGSADFELLNDCRADYERERVLWTVATLGASLVVAGAALVVRPVVRRRRRRVMPIPDSLGLSPILATEAAALGVRTEPFPVWDPLRRGGAAEVWWQPRRSLLELSPGLVSELRRNTPRSRFILRHELAHVRNRDVGLGALADGAAIAFLVAALLPLAIVMLIWFDGPVSTTISALARLGVVGLVLLVARAATLRSRELDADGRAADGLDAPPGVLDAGHAGRPAGGPLAHHPSPIRRRALLADPVRLLDSSVFDGFVAGFATFVLLPTIFRLTDAWLTGTSSGLDAMFWVAVVFALPIGAWLCLAGIRLAWAARLDGRRRSGLRLGLGVALGTLAGLLLLDEPLYQPIRLLDGSRTEAFVLLAVMLGTLGLAVWTVALAGALISTRWEAITGRSLGLVLVLGCAASAMTIGKLGETWRVARFSSELVAAPGQSSWFGAFRLLWVTATSGSFAIFAAAVIAAPVVARWITRSREERGGADTRFAVIGGVIGGLAAAAVFIVYDVRVRDLTTSEELGVDTVSLRYILVAELVIIATAALVALVVAASVNHAASLLGALTMVIAAAIGSVGAMVQLVVRRGNHFDWELVRNVSGQIVPLAAIGAMMAAGLLAALQGAAGRRSPAVWASGLVVLAVAVPVVGLGGAAYAANTVPARREAAEEYRPWIDENQMTVFAPLLACSPPELGGDPTALTAQPELVADARAAIERFEPRAGVLRDAHGHLLRSVDRCEEFLELPTAEPADVLENQLALQAELNEWLSILGFLGINDL